MVFNTNQNRDIVNNLINDFGISWMSDVIPQRVIPSIQPVYEVYGKVVNFIKSLAWTATGGTTTIYTTPLDKDFYLTGVTYNYIKDVVCDQAANAYNLAVIQGGITEYIGLFDVLPLLAQFDSGGHQFSTPIRIDRGTNISISGRSYTAGIFRGRVTIIGYFKYNKDNTGS